MQNQLSAAQQNAGNILNASQGITGANALQSQFLGQYGNLGSLGQQYQQGIYDQNVQNWYNQTYGYQQQQLANMGQALNSVQGAFQGQSQTGLNPLYKPRTAGGAVASAGGGALAGAGAGAAIGAAGGPIGAGGGALIGGAAGLLGYYL